MIPQQRPCWIRTIFFRTMTSILFLSRTHRAFQILSIRSPATVARRNINNTQNSRFLLMLPPPFMMLKRRQQYPTTGTSSTQRWLSSGSSDDDDDEWTPSPANLYQEWSLQDDELLWKNRDKAPADLAFLLGRGMRGIQARLSKLKDVSSPAYERLFSGKATSKHNDDDDDNDGEQKKKSKLVPVSEVLRRVQWDYMLQASDFSVLHYDRVEDTIVESPMDSPNHSVGGSEKLLIDALPEHRIEGIKYKERIVWDRQDRLDLVFGEPGIYEILETYDEWKRERDQVLEWNRQRQAMVAQRVKEILGVDQYAKLQAMSSDLQNQAVVGDTSSSNGSDVEGALSMAQVHSYVDRALELFRVVRQDPMQSLEPSLIPTADLDALDELSELVAVLPDAELRSQLLTDISDRMDRLSGGGKHKKNDKNNNNNNAAAPKMVLSEDDLTETFVRGSGSGGQKVNKTSNRVVLVHEPTQLRVECQDTRSLQQNRKIARKRLLGKLDEYYNGRQSKVSMKQQKASQKRSRTKAKNKARLKKKKKEKNKEQQQQQQTSGNDEWP